MTTTVEVLATAFKDAGTPFIVGHPGGESVELMEAARQRQMRFLLMKQEVAGAMLASTWGDLTGSPGICMSTRGPGATNMVNGVAHAFLDRSPLIAITDAYSRPTYEIGLRQRINQLAIYEPIVKWSTTIDAKTVRQQVRRAMRTATGEPPGPVHFELPQSETTREAGEPSRCWWRTGSRRDRTAPTSSRRSMRCERRGGRSCWPASACFGARPRPNSSPSPNGSARPSSPPRSARARFRKITRCAPAASSAA